MACVRSVPSLCYLGANHGACGMQEREHGRHRRSLKGKQRAARNVVPKALAVRSVVGLPLVYLLELVCSSGSICHVVQ